jgi:hypothetical protein
MRILLVPLLFAFAVVVALGVLATPPKAIPANFASSSGTDSTVNAGDGE